MTPLGACCAGGALFALDALFALCAGISSWALCAGCANGAGFALFTFWALRSR